MMILSFTVLRKKPLDVCNSSIHLLAIFQVKRRVKPPPKDKSEEKKEREHFEEREELDFQFDEELDVPVPSGRHNTFTDW
jgi:hypothetical protein